MYALVWQTPMSRLAAEFGISDVALAKTCERMAIPRPGRGYWARLAAGQNVKKKPLGRLPSGADESWVVERVAEPSAPRPPPQRAPKVTLPDDLRSVHEVVRALGLQLAKADRDEHGRLTIPGERRPVLAVSVAVHRRALVLLAGLAEAAVARGHAVALHDVAGSRQLVIEVGGTASTVAIFERLEPKEHELTTEEQQRVARGDRYRIPKYDQALSGRLQLVLNDGTREARSWSDLARSSLDHALGKVLIEAETHAARVAIHRAEEELRRREEEARRHAAEDERRRQQAAEAQRRHHEHLVTDLRRKAGAWAEAETIRRFLTAVRTSVDAPTEELARWLGWAAAYAQGLDPLSDPLQVALPTECCDVPPLPGVGCPRIKPR